MAGGDRHNADEVLIAALAGGATVARAAAQAGVSERTAWRRLQADDFRARLDRAYQQSTRAAAEALGRSSVVAAVTLRHLLRPKFPAAIRLRAAVALLDLGVRYRESRDQDERLAALEAALAQLDRRPA